MATTRQASRSPEDMNDKIFRLSDQNTGPDSHSFPNLLELELKLELERRIGSMEVNTNPEMEP
jgi:hypothetical protein